MIERAYVETHINEFNKIVNQFSSIEINFDDGVCVLILFASLPKSWEPIGATLGNSVGSENKNLMMPEIESFQKKFIDSN